VIFVVIPGQTRAIAALRPMEELRRIDSTVMGVVANKIPRSRDYYYGGYNYYSPYNSSHYSYHSESVMPTPEVETDEKEATPLVSIFKKNRNQE